MAFTRPTTDRGPARAPVTLDLPEPASLGRMLGPGIIAVGIGMAAGELILWPYITALAGFGLLWLALATLAVQFVINMEIERYTLATGETALTGFSRYWRHWGLVFALLTFLANAWPGWVTSSATMVTFIFGGGNVKLLAILGLASIATLITRAPPWSCPTPPAASPGQHLAVGRPGPGGGGRPHLHHLRPRQRGPRRLRS